MSEKYWISEEQLTEWEARLNYARDISDQVRSQPLPDNIDKLIVRDVMEQQNDEELAELVKPLPDEQPQNGCEQMCAPKQETMEEKQMIQPQQHQLVCSGCGVELSYDINNGWAWNNMQMCKQWKHYKGTAYCGHAITKSEFKGEPK